MDIHGEFLVGTDGPDHCGEWREGPIYPGGQGDNVDRLHYPYLPCAEYWVPVCPHWSLHTRPACAYRTQQVTILHIR